MTATPARPWAPPAPVHRRAWVEQVMGMPVSIHVRGAESDLVGAAAHVAHVFAHLRRAEDVFTTYRPDSELMRVRRGELDVADAHPWMADVTALCAEAEERTDGLFSARAPQGEGHVFDPTGLVKGWAVSAAAEHLRLAPGITYLVNAGGDITAGLGRGVTSGDPWVVGIEDPSDRSRVARTLTLHSGGVATSGAAARGAHVYDPRTGTSVVAPGSATVVGPDLLWCDIWATAAFVDPVAVSDLLPRRDPRHDLLVLT